MARSITLESAARDDAAPGGAPIPYRGVDSVKSTRRNKPGGSPSYFIRTPRNESLQFGPEEYLLWRLVDGRNSFADIQANFTKEFGADISREQFDEFLAELVKCEIVEPLPASAGAAPIGPAAPAPPIPTPPPPPLPPAPTPPPAATSPAAAAPAPGEPVRAPLRRGVNPAPMLLALAWAGGPLRRFRWLLWPTATAAIIVFGALVPPAAADLRGLAWAAAAAALAGGLVALAVVPTLTQACVAAFYGAPSRRCSIAVTPLPHLRFDDREYEALPARAAAIVLAAPLLAELTLFAAGTLFWVAHRGEPMAGAALLAGQVVLLGFLVAASPLLPGAGRKWLGAVLGVDLSRRGAAGGAHVTTATLLWALAVAALATLYAGLLLRLLAVPVGGEVSKALVTAGVAAAAASAILARLWLRSVDNRRATARTAFRRPDGGQTLRAVPEGGVVVPLDRDAAAPAYRPAMPPEQSLKAVIILAVIVALFESVAFVSYPYEAGGYFTILPYDSSQLNARVAGELTEVLVNEGDAVKPGQILGILSDWQQKYSLAAVKAQLENAQANLQNLLHSPQPTDVELARKQYEAAMARLPYDKAQFDRYAALVVNDTVSRANYDQVLSQYQQDQAAAEVARANYDTVRSGPTPDQIEAARALVRQYTATVAYDEDELERTRLRATSYGKVVTPNPMLLRGKWFTQGALVLTVEDHRVVQADVQVPETDIDNVRLGGQVRLRLWGSPEKTALGKSVAIAPDAQTAQLANPQAPQTASSNVIRVRAEVPNPNGLLHPNTDGYAKMAGLNMPTWRAFLQMFERFFLVEIWSWIP